VYYDPINENLIDPSGLGITDATSRTLTVVKDIAVHSAPISHGQIIIRLVKFVARGYKCSPDILAQIKIDFVPHLASMTNQARMQYIHAQVLSKTPKLKQRDTYDQFVFAMIELGFEEEYVKYIQPYEILLNLNQ
jgi:hypothetical protein